MIPFIGGSYTLGVRKADVQRSVNCYPVATENPGGAVAEYLQSIPGLDVFSDNAPPPVLGGWNTTNEVGTGWVFSESNYLAVIDPT